MVYSNELPREQSRGGLALYPMGARQSQFDIRDVSLDEVRARAFTLKRSKVWDFPEPAPCDQGMMAGLPVDPELAGHCGGAALWNWLAITPVTKPYLNDYLHDLYYGMVANAGFPGSEDGVEGRWLPAYALALKRIGSYARARTPDAAINFLLTAGPMPIASPWLSQMDKPRRGVVRALGELRGWHYFTLRGRDYLRGNPMIACQQGWGPWGLNGMFYMPESDLGALMAYGAEVYAMLEKPLPARVRARIAALSPRSVAVPAA